MFPQENFRPLYEITVWVYEMQSECMKFFFTQFLTKLILSFE